MQPKMQTFIVFIALLPVLVLLLYIVFRNNNSKKNPGEDEEDMFMNFHKRPAAAGPSHTADKDPEPGFIPALTIQQISDDNVIEETFRLREITEKGITVSRPGADFGDVILSDRTAHANDLGTEGLIIAKDENGLFGQKYDNGQDTACTIELFSSENGRNSFHPVEGFSITQGTVIRFGLQVLRFVLPSNEAGYNYADPAAKKEEPVKPAGNGAPVIRPAPRYTAGNASAGGTAPKKEAQPTVQSPANPVSDSNRKPVPSIRYDSFKNTPRVKENADVSFANPDREDEKGFKSIDDLGNVPAPGHDPSEAPVGFRFETGMNDNGKFTFHSDK